MTLALRNFGWKYFPLNLEKFGFDSGPFLQSDIKTVQLLSEFFHLSGLVVVLLENLGFSFLFLHHLFKRINLWLSILRNYIYLIISSQVIPLSILTSVVFLSFSLTWVFIHSFDQFNQLLVTFSHKSLFLLFLSLSFVQRQVFWRRLNKWDWILKWLQQWAIRVITKNSESVKVVTFSDNQPDWLKTMVEDDAIVDQDVYADANGHRVPHIVLHL